MKLMLAGAGACVADAFWIEPRWLTIHRREIRLPALPPSLDGLRVGVMADFHYQPEKNDALVAEAVATVAREDLDLVLLPGDFVTRSPAALSPLLDHLSGLNARHGVFASIGNHDGWHVGREPTRRAFEKSGISFLLNEHTRLSIRGEKLALAGIDFVWLGKPDAGKALRGIGSGTPVIALVHEPDYFDTMTARRRIDLQVSGHTHGGQCRVPFLPYTPAKVRFGEKYIRGEFRRGDSRLFVTQGIGTSGLDVRFACPPELAILTLRAET